MTKATTNPTKKTQDGMDEKKNASSQKQVVGDLPKFKFAITSSLETTVPVPFSKRAKLKWGEFEPVVTAPARRIKPISKPLSNAAPIKPDQATLSSQKVKLLSRQLTILPPTSRPAPPKSTPRLLTSTSLSSLTESSTHSFVMGSSSSRALMKNGPQLHDTLSLHSISPPAPETSPLFHGTTPPSHLNITLPFLGHTSQTHPDASLSQQQTNWPSESTYQENITTNVIYVHDSDSNTALAERDPTLPSQQAPHPQMLAGDDSHLVRTTARWEPSGTPHDGKNKQEVVEEREEDEGKVGEMRNGATAEVSDRRSSIVAYFAEKGSNFGKTVDGVVSLNVESTPSVNDRELNRHMQRHSAEEDSRFAASSDLGWRKNVSNQGSPHVSNGERGGHMEVPCESVNLNLEIDVRFRPEQDDRRILDHVSHASSSVWDNLKLHDSQSYGLGHPSSESPTISRSHESEYDRPKSHTAKSRGLLYSRSGSSVIQCPPSSVCSDGDSRTTMTEKSSYGTVAREDPGVISSSKALSHSEPGEISSKAFSRSEPGAISSSKELSLSEPGVVSSSVAHLEPDATVLNSTRDHLVMIDSEPGSTAKTESPKPSWGSSRSSPLSSCSISSSLKRDLSTSITGYHFNTPYSEDSLFVPDFSSIDSPQLEGDERRDGGSVCSANGVVGTAGASTQTTDTWDMRRANVLQGNQDTPRFTLAVSVHIYIYVCIILGGWVKISQ